MTKQFYIWLLFLWGILLVPVTTYACGTKSHYTEKSCTSNTTATNKSEKECCEKEPTTNREQTGCSDNCKMTSCHYSPASGCVMQLWEIALPTAMYSPEKTGNWPSVFHITSGYQSIWLPPKIA